MNSDSIKGSIKELKGKAKEEIGHATGNSKLAIKGVEEQVAGKAQKSLGNAREKVKQTVDRVLNDKPSR